MCLGLFTLCLLSAGVLNGVICLHLDDMWGTGDELFESKLAELDKLVGFGSMKRQEFNRCGETVRETCPKGEITSSMKACIQSFEEG